MKKMLTILAAVVMATALITADEKCWLRGDANMDGKYSMADVIMLINFMPSAHTVPPHICIEWADVNGDYKWDNQDIYYLLAHLFQGGPHPPKPHCVCGYMLKKG
jgi:hypothetical protein